MPSDAFQLPHMAEVFDALRKGRHVCLEDGALFLTLREHRSDYDTLFTNLGFQFREHPRGFFYFMGDSQLSDSSERMAVFMFVLIEALATQGEPVEEALMTRRFDPRELPHFRAARSRQYMTEVGMPSPDDLPNLLKTMDRLGFLHLAPDGSFRFRLPICRFLELCTDFIDTASPEDGDG